MQNWTFPMNDAQIEQTTDHISAAVMLALQALLRPSYWYAYVSIKNLPQFGTSSNVFNNDGENQYEDEMFYVLYTLTVTGNAKETVALFVLLPMRWH